MRLNGQQALERLREGNRRFADGLLSLESLLTHARRKEQATVQEPFAVVLGCSDSRAPAEIVFDQGLGDLFVIRVAGNIAAPSQIGSIDFAVERFGVRLVVVLGHSRCGAVQATIDCLHRPSRCSPGLHAIVDRIRPAVQPLVERDAGDDPERLTADAVRANVRATVNMLRNGSPVLEELVREHGLLVVGAEYSLDTGVVDFFDTGQPCAAVNRAA